MGTHVYAWILMSVAGAALALLLSYGFYRFQLRAPRRARDSELNLAVVDGDHPDLSRVQRAEASYGAAQRSAQLMAYSLGLVLVCLPGLFGVIVFLLR